MKLMVLTSTRLLIILVPIIVLGILFTLPTLAQMFDSESNTSDTILDSVKDTPNIESYSSDVNIINNSFPWEANNEFALNMYDIIKDEPGENIFFSPISVFIAMAMSYEGTDGQTASEIKDVFGLLPDDESRRNAIKSAIQTLEANNTEYTLNVANALWIKDTFNPYQRYVDVLSTYYDSSVGKINTSQSSYDMINNWASDATNEKITNIIEPPIINIYTAIILTNAVYFNGTWVSEFKPTATQNRDFWVDSENSIKTEMMKQSKSFNYTKIDGIKMIQMPYKGDRISMLAIIPDDSASMESLEKKLSMASLSRWIDNMTPTAVEVLFPKFKINVDYDLIPILKDAGIKDAFEEGANFSKLSDDFTYISNALHFAFVDVNEKGTEAAAVTVIVNDKIADFSMLYAETFHADQPFIFMIWDSETNSILFIGKIINPTI